MSPGAIEVNDDGTLQLVPQRAQNAQGLEDALSRFADRTNPSETPPRYRLSAASVWRARRMGLSLETMVQTLETHSGRELPPKVHADSPYGASRSIAWGWRWIRATWCCAVSTHWSSRR